MAKNKQKQQTISIRSKSIYIMRKRLVAHELTRITVEPSIGIYLDKSNIYY